MRLSKAKRRYKVDGMMYMYVEEDESSQSSCVLRETEPGKLRNVTWPTSVHVIQLAWQQIQVR